MGHRGIGRRLAAIMFTDLVGYSASIQKNEPLALRKLDIHRRMVRSLLPTFKGREIETAGDSFLIEFDSSLAAVRYAVALQKRHAAYNKDLAPEQQILVRIGVHLGDIEHERKGVLGDGVNIAARIEPLSPQGGLSITEHIHSHVRNHFEVTFLALGPQILKNIIEPIPVLVLDAAAIASIPEQSPALPKLAAAPRRPPWIVMAAAIVLTALAASGLLLYRQQAQTLPRSIAVLPFDNFGDPQNQYFTDGLQDSLITGLAHIHGLRVIARSSVMQFRKSDRDMRAIGRQLGVARLVEGSVQKEGDHLRINIQMIDPETDSHVWAELYDRSVTDIFTVESQVSEQVAEALKLELSGAEKKNVEQHSTTNLAAYTAYLQGNFYYNRLAEGDLDKAIGFYQESLRLDPGNAQSLAALSSALSSLGDHSTPAEAAQIYQRALAAARQALAIAPGLAQAHVALGWLLLNVDWNISGAELEFHAAESLNPGDDSAKSGLAFALAHLGQFQAAIEMERQASLLDPLYAGYHSNQTWYFTLLGHYDEAEHEAHKALELQPGFPIVHRNLAVAAIRRNDPVAALQYAGQESDPFWKAYALALALQSAGDHAAADAALQALISTYGAVSPFQIASVYAFRGEADQAFKWLDRAYAEHDGGLTELLEDPFLASLKADRRFAALCRKVGLPAPA